MKINNKVKKMLGYSSASLTESVDEMLDAYRDLVCDAKKGESLEDLLDSIMMLSELDETGKIEGYLLNVLRDCATSEELKNSVKEMVGLQAENRYMLDAYELIESVGAVDQATNLHSRLVKELRMAHNMEDALTSLRSFVNKVGDINLHLGEEMEYTLVDLIADAVKDKGFLKHMTGAAKSIEDVEAENAAQEVAAEESEEADEDSK